MPLLQPITERALYIPGANNLGIIATGDGGAIVIDTGIDKDTGRLIRKALDEAGLRLRAIINTHHHADHIGGNDYLVRNVPGVEICAPPLEAALIEHPELEPLYLNMGAAPHKALQNKWVMAKGSRVQHLIEEAQIEICGVALDIVPLAGHSLNQIGVVFDSVCFAADGFFGTAILQKHGIPYAQDVAGQLRSLRALAEREERFFLPGHGELATREQLADVLHANLAAVERSTAAVQAALQELGDLATIGRRVAQTLGLVFAGIPQHAVFTSAVSAHLSYLAAQGVAQPALEDGSLLWKLV